MVEEYGNKMTPTDTQLFPMISAMLKCHQRNLIDRNQHGDLKLHCALSVSTFEVLNIKWDAFIKLLIPSIKNLCRRRCRKLQQSQGDDSKEAVISQIYETDTI